jgi:hypothetical protein
LEAAVSNEQLRWLAGHNPKTGSLSTYGAKDCGYGDVLREGLVIDRGAFGMPDLFITEAGRAALKKF